MTSEQANGSRRGVRRPVLLTVMALGAVMTLTAVNGVFAVFTDRATTGTNSASSRAEARSADIQIAHGTLDIFDLTVACGTYAEDLATGIITVTDMAPTGSTAAGVVCLRNVGSRAVDLTVSAIDLVDTDDDCTGDEGSIDLTCGDDQEGELSPALLVALDSFDCVGSGNLAGTGNLATMQTTPIELSELAAGAVECFQFRVDRQAQGDAITTSQSDTTTWKFAFDATAV
jgi:hypothetical protein